MDAAHNATFISRLTAGDLLSIQEGFTVVEDSVTKDLRLTCDRFCDLLSVLVPKHGTHSDFCDLFNKVDSSGDGLVDWEKFCAYLLLEYYEKEGKVKASYVPQWKDLKIVPLLHREYICSIIKLAQSSRYCSISRDGHICFLNMDFMVVRKTHVNVDSEEIKTRDLWVTSAIAMPNISKLALSTTSKEVLIYDLSSKTDFLCQYKIYGMEYTPLCMDYWYNVYNPNNAVLVFGDTEGNVHCLFFSACCSGLFDKVLKSDVIQEACYAVHILDIKKARYPSVRHMTYRPHSAWIRQVKYLPMLDCFVSCSKTSSDSMVLGWVEKSGADVRTFTFNVAMGVACFDYHQRLNVIATAGVNNLVCLWNPYVASKTVGVLRGHMQIVVAVKFMDEKSQLISVSEDNALRVWDVNLQMCIQRLSGLFPKKPDGHINMFFDAANSSLLTSFGAELVALCMKADTKTRITTHESAVTDIAYHDGLQQLVTVCEGSCINLWLVETGQRVKHFKNAHGDSEITCVALDASKSFFLTGSTDGCVKVWDFNGNCCRVLVTADQTSCDIGQIICLKRFVVAVGWSRQLCCFDMSKVKDRTVKPCEWRGRQEHTSDIISAEFIEPRLLATGGYNGEIVLWNIATQSIFRHLNKSASKTCKAPSALPALVAGGLQTSCSACSMRSHCSDGGQFYSKPGAIPEILHTDSSSNFNVEKHCLRNTGSLDTIVTSLIALAARSSRNPFTADLLSCHGNGVVCCWNTLTGEQLGVFTADSAAESLVGAVDARNHYLVTGSHSGVCRVWVISKYCVQDNISLYEPCKITKGVERSPPCMAAEINAHTDLISSILVLERNGVVLVVTASHDASVKMHTILGELVGVFGQDSRWQILRRPFTAMDEDLVPLDIETRNTASLAEGEESLLLDTEEEGLPDEKPSLKPLFPDALDESLLQFAVWDRTILGKAYGETRKAKHILRSKDRDYSSSGQVFRPANALRISLVPAIEKPDLLKMCSPHVREGRAAANSAVSKLKVRHDEKSIFPKYVLDLETKMKASHKVVVQGATSKTESTSRPNTQSLGR